MQNQRCTVFLLFACLTAISLSSAAQEVIARVPVGFYPFRVAVNSATNKTYVASLLCNGYFPCPVPGTVTVIDGATNRTATVTVGVNPYAIAVNPVTNKIYVANACGNDTLSCGTNLGTVTVIDGATNNTTTLTVGNGPVAVAVNPVTNKIYVANRCGNATCSDFGTVTVIDGNTNNTSTVNVGVSPDGLAVNPVNNNIYVANSCGNDLSCQTNGTVTIIDGGTNNTTTVNVGNQPGDVAVNTVTNMIYVTNCGSAVNCQTVGTVTVIDGATNKIATVNIGVFPSGVTINAVTNKIYVANECGNDVNCESVGTVTVIDGVTNKTLTVNTGFVPSGVALDSVSDKIYVPNECGNGCGTGGAGTATVIDGITNDAIPVVVGHVPFKVAVNEATNRIYVTDLGDNTVSVIAGDRTALQLIPVPPCRLVDTRNPDGEFGGPPIQGLMPRSFTIPDNKDCNIPPTAAAYSFNVTVVPHGPLGYLTIWPTGQDQPFVSTLNSVDGRVKANAAIVPAGTNGAVSIFAYNTTDLILDIDGYFVPPGNSTLAFYPLSPCRVADTRNANGWLGGPYLQGGHDRDFPILDATSCNIPSSAQAYSLNFTALPKGALGYLTVWPAGQARPLVSTLNAPTGTITANAAVVPGGDGGDIAVYPSDDMNLIIDINGYFAAPGQNGLSLYPVAPCRVLDTRNSGSGGPFNGTLSPPVDLVNSPCGIPGVAQAYVLNATVVPLGPLGYLTLWPDGIGQPGVSTLNAYDGVITSDMAIVPAGTAGKVDAYADGLTNLILDISSYFAP